MSDDVIQRHLFSSVKMDRQHIPRGALLTSNLPQLQNLIKRNAPAYREEFLQQWNHYESIRKIFQINPDEQAQHFRQLISFISQVFTALDGLFGHPILTSLNTGCAMLP